jgi:hypothetical protein
MVHQWSASGQPLWFNTIGPPADQQWHLVLIADCRKTDEQNSGRLLVAAAEGMFAGIGPTYAMVMAMNVVGLAKIQFNPCNNLLIVV